MKKRTFLNLVLLLTVLAAATSPAVAETNLLSQWRFDEGEGDIAYDSAGTNNGNIYGATWTTGIFGSALDFNGNGDYIGLNSSMTLSTEWTFSAWLKTSYEGGTKNSVIIGGPGKYLNFLLIRHHLDDVCLETDTNGDSVTILNGAIDSSVGEWAYYTITRSGNTVSGYKNGIFVDDDTLPTGDDNTINKIGTGYGTTSVHTYWGLMDDVRIYDRPLSDEEIRLLYWSFLGDKAFNPHPYDGAINVDTNVILGWSPGKYAVSHDVYFGTNYDDVNDSTPGSDEYMGNQLETSWDTSNYAPYGLEFETTYYWRIDEVNGPNVWKGGTWCFETGRPVIEFSAEEFVFYASEGGANPDVQILGVSNAGVDTLNWEVIHECSWLSAEPSSGSCSSGEINDVTLSVDISGLSAGRYDCNLTISDPDAANSPQEVNVRLSIFDIDVNDGLIVPIEYKTIQAAINAANVDDIVIVLPGTYTGDGNRDIDFLGKAITVRSINPNDPDIVAETIIDCQGARGQGFYFRSGEGPDSVLSGVTIANGGYSGIYCDSSSPTVKNCTFSSNSDGGMANENDSSPTVKDCTFSGNSGSGMVNMHASPIVTNCTFSGNSGSGMVNDSSSPTVKDCTFSGNSGSGMVNMHASPIVTNCTFSGNSGGGMFNEDSSPTVESCTFSSNSAEYDGGGMFNEDSSPTVTNCTFSNNSANRGGGMDNRESNPAVTNCTFSNNSAERGGGMNNWESNPTVTNCIFSGNSVNDDGGGMHNYESSPTVTSCTFSNNSAGGGGGMYNYKSNPTVKNCTFSGNSADHTGGGIDNYESSPTVTNCIFSGNSANDEGGGMYSVSSNPTVTNCTFSGNLSSGSGGGIYNNKGTLTITNCTFSGNSAGDYAGAIYCYSGNLTLINCTISNNIGEGICCRGSTLTITNCILYGNTSKQIRYYGDNYEVEVSYNDIEGGWPGEGNIDADPVFVNSSGGDFRLKHGSPCIDAGTNDPPVDLPETDLDGRPRIINGLVDMGAYEFDPIWHVDGVNGDDNNDGRSPETAFATIQKGIDSAEYGYKVSVYPGVYHETIDFLGKAITVQGAEDAPILQAQDYFAVLFYHGEGPDSILKNFIIENSFCAIYIEDSSPTISNVTVVDNVFGIAAYSGAQPDISNSIFWNNIYGDLFGCQVRYCCVQDGCAGPGNLDTDPCFVDPNNGDYHLKSEGWSWDIERSRWAYDDVTSRCIDAGNPGSPLGDELLSTPDDPNNIWGQNLRINMGAYGGTAEASMPPYNWAILGDLTNDGLVNLKDYAFQAADWLNSADQQPGDLNRDNLIDISDLVLLVEDWLRQTTWYE